MFVKIILYVLSKQFAVHLGHVPVDARFWGRTVACTCQVCVACTCRVSVACTFSVSIYAWDSQQLAGSKVVLSRDHVVN